MKNLIITNICALFLMSSVSTAAEPEAGHCPPEQSEVILKGILTSSTGITFQVSSNGCTTKENFDLLVEESYPPTLTLIQIHRDKCEAFLPYGTTIFYSNSEIGISDNLFQIRNLVEPGEILINIPNSKHQ